MRPDSGNQYLERVLTRHPRPLEEGAIFTVQEWFTVQEGAFDGGLFRSRDETTDGGQNTPHSDGLTDDYGGCPGLEVSSSASAGAGRFPGIHAWRSRLFGIPQVDGV